MELRRLILIAGDTYWALVNAVQVRRCNLFVENYPGRTAAGGYYVWYDPYKHIVLGEDTDIERSSVKFHHTVGYPVWFIFFDNLIHAEVVATENVFVVPSIEGSDDVM